VFIDGVTADHTSCTCSTDMASLPDSIMLRYTNVRSKNVNNCVYSRDKIGFILIHEHLLKIT